MTQIPAFLPEHQRAENAPGPSPILSGAPRSKLTQVVLSLVGSQTAADSINRFLGARLSRGLATPRRKVAPGVVMASDAASLKPAVKERRDGRLHILLCLTIHGLFHKSC